MTSYPLTKTPFGDFRILPDNVSSRERQKYANSNAVTSQELGQLQAAWNNVQRGVGMRMTPDAGVTRAELRELTTKWQGMLATGLATSETFRQLFIEIGATKTSILPIEIKLGTDQPRVLADAFGTSQIDIGDLLSLPVTPPTNNPNALTQTEVVLHFLAERQAASNFPEGLRDVRGMPGDDQSPLDPSDHAAGLNAQNRYRDERGETHVASMHFEKDSTGGQFRITFTDGTHYDIWTVFNNFIIFSQGMNIGGATWMPGDEHGNVADDFSAPNTGVEFAGMVPDSADFLDGFVEMTPVDVSPDMTFSPLDASDFSSGDPFGGSDAASLMFAVDDSIQSPNDFLPGDFSDGFLQGSDDFSSPVDMSDLGHPGDIGGLAQYDGLGDSGVGPMHDGDSGLDGGFNGGYADGAGDGGYQGGDV